MKSFIDKGATSGPSLLRRHAATTSAEKIPPSAEPPDPVGGRSLKPCRQPTEPATIVEEDSDTDSPTSGDHELGVEADGGSQELESRAVICREITALTNRPRSHNALRLWEIAKAVCSGGGQHHHAALGRCSLLSRHHSVAVTHTGDHREKVVVRRRNVSTPKLRCNLGNGNPTVPVRY